MSRKLLAATATISAILGLSVPAIAKTGHARHHLRLVMTGHVLRAGSSKRVAIVTSGDPSATLSHQGFACEVFVGQGPDDATYLTHWTYQSTEFYIRFDVKGAVRYSVTTNCIGALPPGTPVSTHIVSHVASNCGQIDPFDSSKFIKGWGLTTTFPSGMYSVTCNTPAFKL